MIQVISFPKLGIEGLELNRVAFHLGSWPIYWYGIIMGLAFVCALAFICWRSRDFGLHWERSLDILSYSIIGGLIGARIYYVVFSWQDYKDDFMSVFKLWEGGIAVYGSIIGGFITAWILCKKYKVPFFAMSDAAVGGLILGQCIGRWGNFMNVEAFGSNTSLPWGMTGDTIQAYLMSKQASLAAVGVTVDPTLPVHPTFFYESLWSLLGFFAIWWFSKHRRQDGEVTLFYFAWYGLGRAFIEGLRTDSLMLGSVRVSQALAGITVLVCLLWLGKLRRQTPASPLYVQTEQGQQNAQIKPFRREQPATSQSVCPEDSSDTEATKITSEEADEQGENHT